MSAGTRTRPTPTPTPRPTPPPRPSPEFIPHYPPPRKCRNLYPTLPPPSERNEVQCNQTAPLYTTRRDANAGWKGWMPLRRSPSSEWPRGEWTTRMDHQRMAPRPPWSSRLASCARARTREESADQRGARCLHVGRCLALSAAPPPPGAACLAAQAPLPTRPPRVRPSPTAEPPPRHRPPPRRVPLGLPGAA